ncbi:MAG: hypothetical protein O3C57_07535, partial [Verrucomicrobia bacterium]|nr:hypothetical protein [Verrucomicrobiota bacterium]
MTFARQRRQTALCGYVALLLTCTSSVSLANIRFTENIDLPGIGLRIRVMTHAREKPLSPPRIFTYQENTGAGNVNTDMFDPRELWLADQHAGEWIDQSDNALTMAVLRYALPGGFAREHVRREEYQARRPQKASSENWSLESATAWVKTFTQNDTAQLSAVTLASTKFRDLLRVDCTAASPYAFGYLFRLNNRSMVTSANRPDWYLAMFTLSKTTPRTSAIEEAHRKFLPYITSTTLGTTTSDSPSTRFQNQRFSPDNSEKTQSFLRSRQQVASSIFNMKDWWFVETPNYILLSNLDARYRVMVKQLQSDLEGLRTAYIQLIPPRREIKAVSVVRMFATNSEYVDYVGKDYAWTIGLWMGSRKELVIRPLAEQSTQAEKDRIKRTAYHESFHQYLFYALDQRITAAWFNEGHASLFEQVAISRQGIKLGEDPE